MQLHIQPLSNHTPSTIISPPSSHFFTSTKHVPNSSTFKSGFCNSPKRVPESQIILRNYVGLSLKSGFCNSPKRVPESLITLRNYGGLSFNSGFCNSTKRVCELHSGLKNSGDLGVVKCGMMGLQENGDDCDDGYYMRRAVENAKKAIGCTSPNPMVGCVIVKDGKIVGEGFHPKAGQPHAEVFGLRDAGDLAENSTAYVTLEPCNHYGRTPPCSEALIKAKVKKVVVGMVDPNPIVASKGVDKLRDAGIEVIVGVEEELCKSLNEPYIHQMLTGKPFLTVRYSLSMSGSFLNQLGEDVMKSGGYYSKLLQEYDAVIFSAALVTEKCQFPASQESGAKQPLQIIIAKTQLPDLTIDANSTVIIFTDKETTVKTETAQKGIETVVLDILNVDTILEYCKHQGCCSVLLDLRGNFSDLEDILSECLEKNLMQKVVVEVLPILEENTEDADSVALKNLGQKIQSSNLVSKLVGKTVVLEGYFQ